MIADSGTICNVCGKRFDLWDKQENFGIHTHVGYGSIYDESKIDLSLCCDCFDDIFSKHILPICKINPVTEYFDGTPEDISAALEQSMKASLARTELDAAREFLSRLSMYDENGKLKEDGDW